MLDYQKKSFAALSLGLLSEVWMKEGIKKTTIPARTSITERKWLMLYFLLKKMMDRPNCITITD